MNYIRIDGLSDNQMKHADALWTLQSLEEVNFYLSHITTERDWKDAIIAFNMITAEVLDQVKDLEDVSEMFDKFK